MSNLNNYYRAFKNYRKETIDNNVCERDRLLIVNANVENDLLESTKYLCHIEEDWVKAIEEGLEFVEKAVAEERQFIRTQGEVVEIEKVKKISKDSVEHLARHSEMITHVPEDPDADLVPDKLYMVEKLSDYAVYENRFLYMMLCYVRDFINYRLEKIEKLRSSYIGNMSISKEIISAKRKLILETKVYEERQDNPYPIPDSESARIIQKIKDCQQIIMSLLNTDLMVQVAKAPMIKPPITKTNVLKMNNNFKRSLALYDYIASYRGDGYTYEEVKFNVNPFVEKVADELAEAFNLPAFLSYKYGNDIEEVLEQEFQIEERKRREEEAAKLVEQIKRLKKRALESNKTLEEYMVLLEKRNKMLERDSEELTLARHEIEKLNEVIVQLNNEKEELKRQIEALEKEIEAKISEINMLNQKYIEDMARVKKEHEIEIAHLNQKHEEEIEANELKHQEEIIALKEEHALDRQKLIDEYQEEIDGIVEELEEFKVKHQEMKEDYDNKVLVLNEKIKDLNNLQKKTVNDCEIKIKNLEKDYSNKFINQETASNQAIEQLKQEKLLIVSELDAIRAKHGHLLPSIDYTSKERFEEFEEEYEAFKKFFKAQWKLTKKEIRKNILWAKQPKDAKNEEVKQEVTKVIEEKPVTEEETKMVVEEQIETTNKTQEEIVNTEDKPSEE